jgi:hypothetical protein
MLLPSPATDGLFGKAKAWHSQALRQPAVSSGAAIAGGRSDRALSGASKRRDPCARSETRKAWSVTLPLPVWDECARESPIAGRSITECLVSAIWRDQERRKGTLEPLETLDQNVRAVRSAASQLLQEARQVMERVGPLQEIGMRLARIEGVIGARAPLRGAGSRQQPVPPSQGFSNP